MSDDRRAFFRALVRSTLGEGSEDAAPPEPPGLSDDEVERYSRQLVLPQWSEAAQLALREASVLVIGAGALGSPVSAYLAGAGVGRLGIVDFDAVEVSNLHRQTLHFTPDLGAQAFSAELDKLGVEHTLELFKGKHGGLTYRYPGAIRELVLALR